MMLPNVDERRLRILNLIFIFTLSTTSFTLPAADKNNKPTLATHHASDSIPDRSQNIESEHRPEANLG